MPLKKMLLNPCLFGLSTTEKRWSRLFNSFSKSLLSMFLFYRLARFEVVNDKRGSGVHDISYRLAFRLHCAAVAFTLMLKDVGDDPFRVHHINLLTFIFKLGDIRPHQLSIREEGRLVQPQVIHKAKTTRRWSLL